MKTKYKVIIKKSFYEILVINEQSHNFPTHIHNRLCVGKILSGEKYLILNGQQKKLRKNDYYIIPSITPHSCSMEEGKKVSYLILCIDDIEKLSKEMIINDLVCSSIEIGDILSLYNHILKMSSNYFINYNSIILELLKYIDKNYFEKLTLDHLSQKFGFNSYYLLHIFKENVGIPLHQFIIQSRIKKTKDLFLTRQNVLAIALSCGFYDQSHYIRNFRKYVGITPQNYFNSIIKL